MHRPSHTCTHVHTCTHTHCAHTMLMYHLGGGGALTETCTHGHACICATCTHMNMSVCAHIMLMYEHSYRHMTMDTQYTCVHTNLQSEPALPGLRQEIPALLDTTILSHSDSMVLCCGRRNVGLPAIISQEPMDTLKTGVHL